MYEAITGSTVTPTGLTLHQQYPYLGATSDGLVNDCIVVEFKCPFNGRDRSAAEYQHIASVNGKLVLKKTSPYYCQVQGEMAMKKVRLCHFVVWTTVDTALIEVEFDAEFWEQYLLPKLVSFYRTHVAPRYDMSNVTTLHDIEQ